MRSQFPANHNDSMFIKCSRVTHRSLQ